MSERRPGHVFASTVPYVPNRAAITVSERNQVFAELFAEAWRLRQIDVVRKRAGAGRNGHK